MCGYLNIMTGEVCHWGQWEGSLESIVNLMDTNILEVMHQTLHEVMSDQEFLEEYAERHMLNFNGPFVVN